MDDAADRRSQPRVRAIFLLAYTEAGEETEGAEVHIGRTLDVSENGCQIESRTPLAEGQRLSLEIAVDDHIVRAGGEVMHVEPRAGGLAASGIRFTSVGDEDRELLRLAAS